MKIKIEEYLHRKAEDKLDNCPNCNTPFNSFSGNEGIPGGTYCSKCNDVIYDEEGNVLCKLE